MTYPDGSIYEGQWKDDKRNGQGVMRFPDGGRLAGLWKDGNFNGQGTMTYSYGNYEGHWKGGMKSGQGAMTYPDGSKYVGQWKNDRRNGQGTYSYSDGGSYVGQWKEGRKNGQGTYFYPDGGKYVGQFKDGKTYAQGIMTFPDGNNYEGTLENGTFVKNPEYYEEHKTLHENRAKEASAEPEVKVENTTSQQMSEEKRTKTEVDTHPYTIQVGSCQNKENSYNLTMELRKNGLPAFVSPALIPGKGAFHRIFIGYYRTFDETREAASEIRGQKDLHPIEAKMPYAIQVGAFDSDLELIRLEADLRSKEYLAYSIPDLNDNNRARLLIGAFRTEREAARLTEKLQKEGVEAKVVAR